MKKEKYIMKDGSGFRVYINYKDPVGGKQVFSRRIRIADYGSESSALEAATIVRDRALIDLRMGTLIKRSPTVAELYEKKWDLMPKSVTTRHKQDSIYTMAIAPKMATMAIDKVTVAMIQESLNDYARNHTQDMINRAVSVWRQIYQTAQMMEIPVYDRTVQLVIPKSKIPAKHRDVTISQEDFDAFMTALLEYGTEKKTKVFSRKVWNALQIMRFTGMRPAEVFALSPEDIDFRHNLIHIRKAIGSDFEEETVVVPTKTEQSTRVIPLPSAIQMILLDLVHDARHGYLLPGEHGKPMDINRVTNHITLVSRKCGIPFRSYMLRHQFATDLINSGTSPRVTQDLMGHASYSMTVSYARSTEAELKNAVENRNFS